jgi:hypothetical protein
MGLSRPYRADRLYSSAPRLEAWAMFPWPFGPLSTLPALPACERMGYRLSAIGYRCVDAHEAPSDS